MRVLGEREATPARHPKGGNSWKAAVQPPSSGLRVNEPVGAVRPADGVAVEGAVGLTVDAGRVARASPSEERGRTQVHGL